MQNKHLKGIKEVFSKPFYVLTVIAGALAFYLLNVIIADFAELAAIAKNYSSWISLKILVNYFIGFPSTIKTHSAVSLIIMAILFGIYIALATYKVSQIKKTQTNSSILGTTGIFLGFIAPGCAACGIGIASALGLAGAFLSLPFEGLEISIIAIILLSYANWSISGKITQATCAIPVKRNLK